MVWTGQLLHIFVAERAAAPMHELQEAKLVADIGIEGDRYATGQGYYSNTPRGGLLARCAEWTGRQGNHSHTTRVDRQITLIEMETLEALVRDHRIRLKPSETRRNLVTRDVPLNHLVGCRFLVGETVLYGERLNVPCMYLEKLLGKAVFKPLLHRSGLNCRIIHGGVIHPGDSILPEN